MADKSVLVYKSRVVSGHGTQVRKDPNGVYYVEAVGVLDATSSMAQAIQSADAWVAMGAVKE